MLIFACLPTCCHGLRAGARQAHRDQLKDSEGVDTFTAGGVLSVQEVQVAQRLANLTPDPGFDSESAPTQQDQEKCFYTSTETRLHNTAGTVSGSSSGTVQSHI